jgi:PQQ-like domain
LKVVLIGQELNPSFSTFAMILRTRVFQILVFGLFTLLPCRAQVNILTNRYDSARTAANLSETVLNSTNVNVNQFGKLYTIPVDGAVYAQPLYVSNLAIPKNGTHNVLYVATMNDKVYAFDASTNAALWTRNFTKPSAGVTAVPIVNIVGSNSLNIIGNVGVESTPVIDSSTATMYLIARTLENGTYVQRLHALNITSGAEKFGGPVVIQGSVAGTGYDNVNGTITFDPKMENQRSSLALINGRVLIAWGSHEDIDHYHGWVMAYNAANLQQTAVFCVTPDGQRGGIWQGSRAPVIDGQGNVYYETGNGDWEGTREFGDSVIKFNPGTNGLSVLDYFTPSDYSYLETQDVDLGSTGSMLIPNTSVLVSGGKESILYLLNLASMGHEMAGNTQILQSVALNGGEMKPGPAYWNSPAGGLVYIWAQNDVLRAFHFNGSTLDTPAYASGAVHSPGSPGGTLSVSANGQASGSGIVWAQLSTTQNDDHGLAAGILRAYNAQTLQEIWNTEQLPTRDRLGTLVKFVPPLVANGKLYAATYDNALAVYGLLPTGNFSLSASPSSNTVRRTGTASYTVTVTPSGGFSGTVNLNISPVPKGATATFTPTSISGAGTAALKISTTNSAPVGSYTLAVTGVAGSLSHSANVTLSVTKR